ncbi:MAG: acyltransferase [Dokdonella sp.]|nr:MAG: acyltransferase [Dokdonella sp.]
MRSPNLRYLPAVDHVRAYAALLIVFYHGLHVFAYEARFGKQFGIDHWLQPANPLLAALAEGHTAVALFMVLSGFILTLAALPDGVRWLGFIRNRLLRTYPLFVLLTFAGIAAMPQNFSFSAVMQQLLGLGNEPGTFVAPPFTSLLWTIAVEWQFYLIFPLLVAVLAKGWTRQVAGFIAVLLLLRLAVVIAGGNAREVSYMQIIGRLDQFLLGMWAAWRWRERPPSPRGGAILSALALLAAILGLWALNASGGWPTTHGWKILMPTVEGAVWAAFVLGYVAWANEARHWWSRALAWIGEISYSIYLLHFVVIWSLLRSGLVPVWSGRFVVDALLNTLLLALPITLAVSALSYRFVERPFLRLRGTYHRDQGTAAGAP